MNRQERLERLRELRIERQEEDEPVFESHSACLEWIDKVAPLLSHDQRHYNSFQQNAQFMRFPELSATRLMTHLNAMISTVNQAIAELESHSDSEPPKVTEAPLNKAENDKWVNRPLGKIVITVAAGLILAAIIWAINYFSGIGL